VEKFALPSYGLLVVETACTLGVLLLAGWRPLTEPSRRLQRFLAPVEASPRRTMVWAFLLAFGVTLASFGIWGVPIPKVTDEYGHLLVADTWLHGRLANPPHPMWPHFDIYALQFPTYASKYPPGQGALLALGGLLGNKALGCCLGAGFLAATMAWAFFRWLRPRWALLGTLLVLMRLAIGSYWHQSYWGGTVAAVGGALLFGALAPRLAPRPAMAALGLVLLAVSRPFEGLLVALPCLFYLLARWSRLWRREGRRAVREPLVLLALLVPVSAGILYQNWRITGDGLLFPQAGYVTAYNGIPDFIFQASFGKFEGHQLRAPQHTSQLAQALAPNPLKPWLGEALKALPARLAASLFFYLGIAGSLAFLLGLATFRREQALALAALITGTLGQSVPTFYFPHHASPLTFIFYYFCLEGIRRAALLRWPAGPAKGHRPAYRLALLLLLAELVSTTLRFPSLRPLSADESFQRAGFAKILESLPGRHLVIIEPRSSPDWVWNSADIDSQKIVWARTLDLESDLELRKYFAGRHVWRADLSVEPPSLEPLRPAPPQLRAYREAVTGMVFVEIPPSTFEMGSATDDPGREEGERLHPVTLTHPYWIGRTEVTQAQWQKVMGHNPSHFQGDGTLPVEMVNYFEIETFLERLEALAPGNHFRLPTEAEWENACHAGASTPFAFGQNLSTTRANFDDSNDDASGRTLPVASFPPNAWGLYDFHGNVWEWCADEPCAYSGEAETDPVRSCGNPLKVIRGGSWHFGADSARCALRYTHAPNDRGFSLGFRVVREIKAESP